MKPTKEHSMQELVFIYVFEPYKHLLRTFFLKAKISCCFKGSLIRLFHCFLPTTATTKKRERAGNLRNEENLTNKQLIKSKAKPSKEKISSDRKLCQYTTLLYWEEHLVHNVKSNDKGTYHSIEVNSHPLMFPSYQYKFSSNLHGLWSPTHWYYIWSSCFHNLRQFHASS